MRLAANPRRLEAACCTVEVIQGGRGTRQGFLGLNIGDLKLGLVQGIKDPVCLCLIGGLELVRADLIEFGLKRIVFSQPLALFCVSRAFTIDGVGLDIVQPLLLLAAVQIRGEKCRG